MTRRRRSFNELFARYERVIEVVSRNDDDRARARLRFKAYREQGFEPTTHRGGQQ